MIHFRSFFGIASFNYYFFFFFGLFIMFFVVVYNSIISAFHSAPIQHFCFQCEYFEIEFLSCLIVGKCFRIEKDNKFSVYTRSEVKHPTLSIHPFNVNYAERRHFLPSKSMKTKTLKILKYVIINNHDSILSCVTCWYTYFYSSFIFRSYYEIRLNQHLRFVFNTYEMSLKRCWPLTFDSFQCVFFFAFFDYVLQLETHYDWHYFFHHFDSKRGSSIVKFVWLLKIKFYARYSVNDYCLEYYW